ncbi:MAG: aldehyde dehydrogenase family protein [Solirubrobacteraceae bacterium]
MATPQQLFIGGQWRDAASGATSDVLNSFTGERVTTQAAAGVEDVDAAVTAAAAAFPAWAATEPAQRRELLIRAGELLSERAAEIAKLVSEETSGTFGWGMFNCGLAASMFAAAGEAALSQMTENVPSAVPGLDSQAVRQPLGVCVGIAPWNAPVILGARSIIWPLAFGNTVILKGSEQSPRVHGEIVRALVDAGAPEGVIGYVTNDPGDAPEVVGALIEHPQTAHINFTGSSKVGTIIASKAAPLLKRTLLELGGKAPLVILDDADLDAAAAAANFGAFMHAGQICMSTERIVVDGSVADEFVRRLVDRADALTSGSPFEESTMVGPVVTTGAARHVEELIDDARSKGATVAAGGKSDGTLHRPTVLTGITPAMRIYSEESFGPIVTVVSADGIDDAVRIANDTDYGLSAAVFGEDVDRAFAVARRIDSGICHVNGATVHDEAAAPFGGVKHSGWGRFGAGQVIDEFTTLRWITISREARSYPI